MKDNIKFDYKEREAEFDGTFHFASKCNDGCHHIYDDQGNPQNLEEVKAFMKQTLRLYMGSVKERVDSEKKSVKELFPDAVKEPTKEFAEFVMMKDQYNRAKRETIEMLDQDEEVLK